MTQGKLRAFLADLAEGESFDSPVVEGGNQGAKTHFGVVAATLIVCLWVIWFGEAPSRVAVVLGLVVVYATFWEAGVQGWRPGDSWFDTAMFGAGAAFILPFSEVSVQGGIVNLNLSPVAFLAVLGVWAVAYTARLLPRILGRR